MIHLFSVIFHCFSGGILECQKSIYVIWLSKVYVYAYIPCFESGVQESSSLKSQTCKIHVWWVVLLIHWAISWKNKSIMIEVLFQVTRPHLISDRICRYYYKDKCQKLQKIKLLLEIILLTGIVFFYSG